MHPASISDLQLPYLRGFWSELCVIPGPVPVTVTTTSGTADPAPATVPTAANVMTVPDPPISRVVTAGMPTAQSMLARRGYQSISQRPTPTGSRCKDG
ncbi:hypothetical protein PC128_g26802 [Phytophthora cactorum]|nr:hypothetical protein PC121_g22907 [Phytophthora cactorum]KAG3129889.1 hypothetical protein PC128_g26802 [Phytophthora cactorum]KAG4038886.1 hypothetical protein PC123_g25557 [Phytophthora cactorum]